MDDLLIAAAVARLEAARSGARPGGLGVAVVVDDFAPDSFVRGTIDFAIGVPAETGEAWHASFTRTIFLAGRPASVASRYPDGFVTADARLGWHGPAPAGHLRNLSRLLRAFHGPATVRVAAEPFTVTVPGAANGHTVHAALATGGVSVRDYLVHVHHLFAEATLRGLIRPGDAVSVAHRPDLDDPTSRRALDPARAGVVQTRISHHGQDSERLRLYAVLTSERKEG